MREIARVAVRAILARRARQSLADPFILVAEIGGCAGVQSAGDLGAGGFGGSRLSFLAACSGDGRALGIRRLAAAQGNEQDPKTSHRHRPRESPYAAHLGKMIAFGHGGKAYPRMRRLL